VFLGFHRSIPFLVSLRTFFYFDSLLFFGMITAHFAVYFFGLFYGEYIVLIQKK
ncbi:hypothetical protein DFR44_12035, partial [Hydromonas duriensis]